MRRGAVEVHEPRDPVGCGRRGLCTVVIWREASGHFAVVGSWDGEKRGFTLSVTPQLDQARGDALAFMGESVRVAWDEVPGARQERLRRAACIAEYDRLPVGFQG